jgi:hypothetical protein
MSFRQFGGMNYAARHNIVGSNYNTSNNLLVTQNVGQPNSYINFESDISGNINVYGNLDVSGNLDVGGNIDCSGNITAEYIFLSSYPPTVNQAINSVVPKGYIDTIASGIKPLGASVTVSFEPITLSGTSQTVSGVPLASYVGSEILVNGQGYDSVTQINNPDINNGVYIISSGAWQRSPYLKPGGTYTEANGTLTTILQGDYRNHQYICVSNPSTVDQDALLWSEFDLPAKIGQGLESVFINNETIIQVKSDLDFLTLVDASSSNPNLDIGTDNATTINIGQSDGSTTTTIYGPTDVDNSLSVSGATTLSSTLGVTGVSTLTGGINLPTLTQSGGITWGSNSSNIYDNANLYIVTNDYMYITAPTSLTITSNATSMTGTLNVTGSISISNQLVATQTFVTTQGYITSSALTPYALLASANFTSLSVGSEPVATETFVTTQGYITSSALTPYALLASANFTSLSVGSEPVATETYVTTQGYITSSALNGYATETYVTTQGYITSSALNGYATETYVTTQGYITSSALNGYATETYVTTQGYITSSALTPYAPLAGATFTGPVTATSFTSGSDYRLKTNIKSLDNKYTVDNLNPVEYDMENRHDMGFIAHELQEHYPFLVDGEKDGEKMQSINYNGFIALLVKEIQMLKNEIKELKQKIK